MAEIDSISLGTSLDLSGLFKGFDDAATKIDDFLKASASRLMNVPVRANSQGSGSGADLSDMTSQADELRSAFAPLGVQIRQALGQASQPLAQFAATFGAQFEQVGPVVEKLAIRIDDAMRFPKFLERVDAFRKGFLSRFEDVAVKTPKIVDKAVNHEADATKLVGSFESARKRVQAAVKPIPNDVGYALEAATHVDHVVAFPQFLKGLDGLRSGAIDRMQKMADGIANATGKGSRKARWAAKASAAGISSMQANRPAPDNTTRATVVKTTGWERVGRAIQLAGEIEERTQNKIAHLVARDARDIDRLIGAWLGFKKVGSALSTFGSIAGATFAKVSGIKLPKFSIDSRQSQVLQGVGRAAQSATSHFKGLLGTAAAAAGIFSVSFTAIDFLKNGIKGASDLNETLSKTDVILGQGSPKVKAFADDMASKFGLVKGITLDTAASFGGLGKSLGGLKGDQLADFSTNFTKMAADLSSFQNIDMGAAGDAIRIGLSGNQSDKLKELGVILDEDRIKSFAYSNGIARVNTALNEQQKFAARAGLITQGLSAASGDLERTQGGSANQTRKLWGTIENLGTSIGTVLLPAFNAGTKVLNEFASIAYSAFEGSKATLDGWVETAISGFDLVGAVVTHMPDAFEVARLVILEKLTNITEYLTVLGPNAVKIAEYIGENWLLLIGDAFEATYVSLQNLWKNFQSIGEAIFAWLQDPTKGIKINWTPLLDGFQAVSGKFPELLKPTLTDMSKQIADASRPILDDVAARKAKRAAEKNAPVVDKTMPGMSPADVAKPKGGDRKEVKTFAGAAELGSSEFYTGIVNHANRANGLEDLAKQGKRTADNTALIARELAAMRRDINGRPNRTAMQIP